MSEELREKDEQKAYRSYVSGFSFTLKHNGHKLFGLHFGRKTGNWSIRRGRNHCHLYYRPFVFDGERCKFKT